MVRVLLSFLLGLLMRMPAPLSAQLLPPGALIQATAVDANGSIYLAGRINAPDLPTTPGVWQSSLPAGSCPATGCVHGFLAKVSKSGETLEWATYLAGDGYDQITALAVSGDGNLYAGGSTTPSNLLPVLGGYQSRLASLFAVKLSSDGKALLAATHFGGLAAAASNSAASGRTSGMHRCRPVSGEV